MWLLTVLTLGDAVFILLTCDDSELSENSFRESPHDFIATLDFIPKMVLSICFPMIMKLF